MRSCNTADGARRAGESSGCGISRRRRSFLAVLTLGFATSVGLFFAEGATLPFKVAYPAAWLAAGVFALCERAVVPVACALLFSAAGDAAGAVHDFLLQMTLFALAHAAYIVYFLSSADLSRRRIAFAAVAGVGMLLFVFIGIVPRVAPAVERAGVAVYGTVITAMWLGAWFYRGRGRTIGIVAAALFLFSDATLAWNKFAAPVPDAEYRIMAAYYAAQYLFASAALLRSQTFRPAN